MDTCTIQSIAPRDRRPWLRRLLDAPDQTASECEQQVTAFAEYARAMSLDLSRMWTVRNGQSLPGDRGGGAVVLCIPSPGRTAMLLLPDGRVHASSPDDLSAVVRHAMSDPSLGDVRLFQSLLVEADRRTQAGLEAVGFGEIATLIYMERDVSTAGLARRMIEPRPDSFGALSRWIGYDAHVREMFGETILATYEGSQDCPGLAGLRGIDDIIASHMAAGRFAAHRWRLLLISDRPAGCILLAEHPLQPALEVAYMGVVPEFRHRGVGGRLVQEALAMAHREQFQRVTLAVDTRNEPAIRMYHHAGFIDFLRRRAMVRATDSSSVASRR